LLDVLELNGEPTHLPDVERRQLLEALFFTAERDPEECAGTSTRTLLSPG
jgi:hypothetical protein